MDASPADPSAPSVMAADNNINNPLIPRDETAAILEQTFGNGDTISVDPDNNTDAAIGSAMCEKILESSVENSRQSRRLNGGGGLHGGPGSPRRRYGLQWRNSG
jgi:hypothetical protein